jgi:nucleoside-diphosphate-sugar epimerase
MQVILTSPRSELGGIVARRVAEDPRPDDPSRVVINVALQAPNSLLHDGHTWKRYPPDRLLRETRDAVRRAQDADFLVHASYVLAGAPEAGIAVGEQLQPIIDATLEAESMVLAGGVAACVLRLGYLYGPESRNLKAYRRAFRIGRPYWAGRDDVQQRFLHTEDAATALLLAATQRPSGRLRSATDQQPVSFASFMDHFAKLVGNPLPLHLPAFMAPVSRIIIAAEHMQMVEVPTAAIPRLPSPRGFRPAFPRYRAGLRQVVDAWG